MEDFRDVKSTDFLYEVGNSFLPIATPDNVLLTRS